MFKLSFFSYYKDTPQRGGVERLIWEVHLATESFQRTECEKVSHLYNSTTSISNFLYHFNFHFVHVQAYKRKKLTLYL